MQVLAAHPTQLVWDPVEETWLRAEEVPLPSSASVHGMPTSDIPYLTGGGRTSPCSRRSPSPAAMYATRSAGHSPYLAPTTLTILPTAISARQDILLDHMPHPSEFALRDPPPCYVQSQLEEATRRARDKEQEQRRLRDEAAVAAAHEHQRILAAERDAQLAREREQALESARRREREVAEIARMREREREQVSEAARLRERESRERGDFLERQTRDLERAEEELELQLARMSTVRSVGTVVYRGDREGDGESHRDRSRSRGRQAQQEQYPAVAAPGSATAAIAAATAAPRRGSAPQQQQHQHEYRNTGSTPPSDDKARLESKWARRIGGDDRFGI